MVRVERVEQQLNTADYMLGINEQIPMKEKFLPDSRLGGGDSVANVKWGALLLANAAFPAF